MQKSICYNLYRKKDKKGGSIVKKVAAVFMTMIIRILFGAAGFVAAAMVQRFIVMAMF